ncbi:MAG: hypothetical protein AAFZ09_11720, partial [Pseudomonadota bacterium]
VPNALQIGADRFAVKVTTEAGKTGMPVASVEHRWNRAWPWLMALRPVFRPNGYAHFFNCEVGQDIALMTLMAATIGVPVVGHTGFYYTDGSTDGEYTITHPDGRSRTTSEKPNMFTMLLEYADGP